MMNLIINNFLDQIANLLDPLIEGLNNIMMDEETKQRIMDLNMKTLCGRERIKIALINAKLNEFMNVYICGNCP